MAGYAYFTLGVGLLLTLLMILLLEEKLYPVIPIGLISLIAAPAIAEKFQFTRDAVANEGDYEFQPWWKVIALTVMWLTITILFAWIVMLIRIFAGK